VALSRVQLAEAGEGLEALEEGLGKDREVGPPAHLIEIIQEAVVGVIESSSLAALQDAVGGQEVDVPLELLAVEIAKRAAFLRVHSASKENVDSR
jgi:hypothetical protein